MRRIPELARDVVCDLDLENPEILRQLQRAAVPGEDPAVALQRSTTRWLMADRTIDDLRETLNALDIDWYPIKGVAVGTHDYPLRELRPICDVDVLLRFDDLRATRAAMSHRGWCAYYGEDNRIAESYLQRCGYCWPAVRPGFLPCEVHFRLWGALPLRTADDAMSFGIAPASEELPTLGPAARYVLAATHVWMNAPPRPIHGWWDLEMVAGSVTGSEVERLADKWHLQLPVAMAAVVAAEMFDSGVHRAIARALMARLRPVERWTMWQFRGAREDLRVDFPQSNITVARLLSGRALRHTGSAANLWRLVWPHRFAVESRTPREWHPVRRRVIGQLRHYGLLRTSDLAARKTG